MSRLIINAERLWQDLESLSTIREGGLPGWTRRAFTPTYIQGRQWLSERMAAAGLAVAVTPAGNLFGRREGEQEHLPPIVIGSHTDTVAGGGRFDGPVGVLAALEAARTLHEAGVRLRHPLVVADLLAEETTEFGLSCIGSRIIAQALPQRAWERTNRAGETLADSVRRVGGDPAREAEARIAPGDLAAYLELHIEQGAVLEQQALPLGIVLAIVGIRRYELRFRGRPDHAGTTPMSLRHDAFMAACETALALERAARQAGAVGTVGEVYASPNFANIVPGQVTLRVEFRSESEENLDSIAAQLAAAASAAGGVRGVQVELLLLATQAPVPMSPAIRSAQARASANLGFPCMELSSGAGHDAAHMARICQAGMFFIPCREGRSHCPEEWAEPVWVATGALAVAETIRLLDAELEANGGGDERIADPY